MPRKDVLHRAVLTTHAARTIVVIVTEKAVIAGTSGVVQDRALAQDLVREGAQVPVPVHLIEMAAMTAHRVAAATGNPDLNHARVRAAVLVAVAVLNQMIVPQAADFHQTDKGMIAAVKEAHGQKGDPLPVLALVRIRGLNLVRIHAAGPVLMDVAGMARMGHDHPDQNSGRVPVAAVLHGLMRADPLDPRAPRLVGPIVRGTKATTEATAVAARRVQAEAANDSPVNLKAEEKAVLVKGLVAAPRARIVPQENGVLMHQKEIM